MKVLQNFVGDVGKTGIPKLGEANTWNMLYQTTKGEKTTETILTSIPGYSTMFATSGKCRGIYKAISGNVFSAFGSKVYFNNFPICDIANSDKRVVFCETGGHKPRVVFVDGENCYAVLSKGSVSEIQNSLVNIEVPNDPWLSTSGNPVAGRPISVRYVNETVEMLMEDSDRVYQSYQKPWEWTPATYKGGKTITNFNENQLFATHFAGEDGTPYWPEGIWYTLDYKSDIATDMVLANGVLYVVGSESVQAMVPKAGNWQNGTLFDKPKSLCKDYGCYKNACAEVNSHFCLYGKDGVYVDGARVSDVYIEDILGSDVVCSGSLHVRGHFLYVIKTMKCTMGYDIDEGKWTTLATNIAGRMKNWIYSYPCGEYLGMDNAMVEVKNTFKEANNLPLIRGRRGRIYTQNLGNEIGLDMVRLVTDAGRLNGQGLLKVTSDVNIIDERSMKWSSGDFGDQLVFFDFGIAKFFDVEFRTTIAQDLNILGLELDVYESLGGY